MNESCIQTEISVPKNIGVGKPLCLVYSPIKPEIFDVDIVLLNCAQSVTTVFEREFKNYQCIATLYEENLYQVLSSRLLSAIPNSKVLFVLIGVRGGDQNLGELVNLINIFRKQFSKLHFIICSDLGESHLHMYFPDVSSYKFPTISEIAFKDDPRIFRHRISDILTRKTNNSLEIGDFQILELLNKTKTFKLFGLPFEPFLDIAQLEKLRESKNLDEYSLWFDITLYKKIIFHLIENFKSAKLDFLVNLINNFTYFERLSYVLPYYAPQKRYRDHFLHQLRIAILGDFFLDLYLEDNMKLIDLVNRILRDQDEANTFPHFRKEDYQNTLISCRLIWWVIGLMHDCTYPLNAIFSPPLFSGEGRVKMLNTYVPEFIKPYIKGHQWAAEKLKNNLRLWLRDFLPYLKINDSGRQVILNSEAPHLQHNITSAFNLWWIYNQQSRKDKRFCPDLAAQSILLHHPFPGSGIDDFERIRFGKNPLAFLLILLDEVQDWGRPAIITTDQWNPTSMDKSIDLGKIKIEGITRMKEEPHKWKLSGHELVFTLDFEKNDNLKEGVAQRIIAAKEENLGRLYIGSQSLPDIKVRLKFKGLEMKEISIRRAD